MQAVHQLTSARITELQQYYHAHLTNPPAGAIFRAKTNGVVITAYRSGKVMFQGPDISRELGRWHLTAGPTNNTTPASHRPSPATKSLPNGFSSWSVLGSDEVGTGSYFGPLTVAAVFVSHTHLTQVKGLGIQDSKKLTDPEIIKMAKQLITFLPYHVVNLMPAKYNQLMDRYHNQGKLKALCHNLALQKVLQKLQPATPDAILIDQFVAPATYFRYLHGQDPIIKDHVYFQTKGEQAHLAVAAASVLARYVSLQVMDQLTEKAGITLPIGAGNAVDQIAAKLLNRGLSLDEFAKVHFANTQKAHLIVQQ